MLYKQRFLAFTMLFILILSSTFLSFATDNPSPSPEDTKSGEISGELVPPVDSGDIKSLNSTAESTSISTYKNTSITSSLRSILASGEENLTYVIDAQPIHGTLLYDDNQNTSFTYTPYKDYLGKDSFSFRLTDGTLYSNTATVTITVIEDPTPVIPFNYIDMQNHWANYSASHLAARSIIIGEQIGDKYYFCPNKLVTRGDFILYLLAVTKNSSDLELEIPNISFADENLYPEWMLDSAKLAYAKGIIKGASSGNKLYLNLYNNLTRAEASAMINNVLKLDGKDVVLEYSDKNVIPNWTIDAVKALTGYKIIQGDGNYFRPTHVITKAEAGEMCFKVLKQLENEAMTMMELK